MDYIKFQLTEEELRSSFVRKSKKGKLKAGISKDKAIERNNKICANRRGC